MAGGRVVGVYDGTPEGSAREVIDLRGLTLIPGSTVATFIDGKLRYDAGLVS